MLILLVLLYYCSIVLFSAQPIYMHLQSSPCTRLCLQFGYVVYLYLHPIPTLTLTLTLILFVLFLSSSASIPSRSFPLGYPHCTASLPSLPLIHPPSLCLLMHVCMQLSFILFTSFIHSFLLLPSHSSTFFHPLILSLIHI